MKSKILLLAIFVILSASCRKLTAIPEGMEASTNGSSVDGNPIIGTWKITATDVNIDYGEGVIVDLDGYGMLSACDLDDTAIFQSNFTLIEDEGATKCDSSLPQTQAGKWSLSSDKKKLTIEFPPHSILQSLDADVLQLDSKVLKIRYVTYFNGPTTTTVTTYSKVK